MESVRDNPVTIAMSANGVGKTHGAARIATWWYKTRLESQVYTAAAPPKENLEKLLWGELGQLVFDHPHVFKDDRPIYLNIIRGAKQFITGVTIPNVGSDAQKEARFSGKHAPYLLFILDEGDAIPTPVYRGIKSCLSGDNGRLLIMYNPRSDEGEVQAYQDRGVVPITLTAFDHPNVITGENLIPGAVTRNKTLHRIHRWTVPDTPDYEGVVGYGRFTVPQFLENKVGINEETQEPFSPLPPGDRIIVEPEFCYMVLARFPGIAKGVIYDTWRDGWDEYKKHVLANEAQLPFTRGQIDGRFHFVDNGSYEDIEGMDWAGWPQFNEGNVSPEYDYEPGAGQVYWAIDDGYVGTLDPDSRMFTADSHPRAILFFQVKSDGSVVLFDEYYKIREPRPEVQIKEALSRPYAKPQFVAIGPGSAALGGILMEMGLYKRGVQVNVEESIKKLREWISPDEKQFRRLKVNPRCRHFRYEMGRYKRDDNGRLKKEYDHGPDAARYFAWVGRNGF